MIFADLPKSPTVHISQGSSKSTATILPICFINLLILLNRFAAENNPKFLNTKLKEAKKLSKVYPPYNPYSGVYSMLQNTAKSNINAKQQYINGHY